MDLSWYTPAQRACVRYCGDSLFIKAGAGVGKTRTLTAKVVYLLSEGGELGLTDVDELLAITFTRRAAGELVSRIRTALRSERMPEQALKADAARISTIHGACARILRTHAFELECDPSLPVLDDLEADRMLDQAIDEVLAGLDPSSPVLREFRARPAGSQDGSATVLTLLRGLTRAIRSCPEGAAGLHEGPAPRPLSAVADGLSAAIREFYDATDEYAGRWKSLDASRAKAQAAAELLEGVRDREDVEAFPALVEVLETGGISRGNVKDEVVRGHIARYRAAFDDAGDALRQHVAYPLLRSLLDLAGRACGVYGRMKRERGVVDNDDLVARTCRLLEEDEALRERYQRSFRLVMIDEFQDTDVLQTRIARLLSPPGSGQLCTVGDAQQSVYRFRGADVELFRRFERELPEGSETGMLDVNFRSHADILAFVNAVFGAPQVFGDDYLELRPQPGRRDADLSGLPRVDLVMTTFDGTGGTAACVAEEAAQVARRLKEFARRGWSLSQMVVLLGRMSHADVYADALRDEGLDAVITGGSVFWRSDEPRLVEAALRFLANPYDADAAYRLLVSPLFRLTTEELGALVTSPEGGRRVLFGGLVEQDATGRPRVALAQTVLLRALEDARVRRASGVVRRMFVESGLVARLAQAGPSGMASCANVSKALSRVEQLEAEGVTGCEGLAHAYAQLRASRPAEAPGVLSARGGEAVQVMTIHASKGLEFPVVAVADFADVSSPGALLCETTGGETYLSLAPSASLPTSACASSKVLEKDADVQLEGVSRDDLDEEGVDREVYHRRLKAFVAQEDVAEARRRFYVAATRAREALVIAFHPGTRKETSKKGTRRIPSIKPPLADLAALCAGGVFPEGDGAIEFGGSAPARFSHVVLDGEDAAQPAERRLDEPSTRAAEVMPCPVLGQPDEPVMRRDAARGGRVDFSYSSIAARLSPSARTESFGQEQEGGGEDATELGLAFHLVAQHLAESGRLGDGTAEGIFEDGTLVRLEAAFRLSASQRRRLVAALHAWIGSDVARRACAQGSLQAEVPFLQRFATDLEPPAFYLDGQIDLLCLDRSGRDAFIVDYKTGGRPDEDGDELSRKHRLQALCYAEALLSRGVERVELAFVRVEQVGEDGQPQTVPYSFGARDRDAVHARIDEALHEAFGRG